VSWAFRARPGLRAVGVSVATAFWLLAAQGSALAAGPPQIVLTAVEGVSATAVTLRAAINPEGLATTYRFEYLSEAAFEANVEAAREPFTGATPEPASVVNLGAGTAAVKVSQHPTGLAPSSAYRYRVRAANSAETVFSVARPFATQDPTNAFALLDGRGWEMVSPLEKNGGAVQGPGEVAGGGVFQAAANGSSLTYSSADSFYGSALGAPAGSQYLSTHQADSWSTADITAPLLAGSYGSEPDGVPYQLFSPDLSRALMSGGERCRANPAGECPVSNPPLPGSGAPAGYRDYYLRDGGGFHSLLTQADLEHTSLSASEFQLRLVGADPDLAHAILSSCASLAPGAVEVAAGGGCDEGAQNLYEWSGGDLSAINLLPGETQSAPGATIAAPAGAVSADGSRVYWTREGNLYLREAAATKLLGAEATFEAASSNGEVAFYLKGGHLYRYEAEGETSTDLTPGEEVKGVFGASADGSHLYYESPAGIFLWQEGTSTSVTTSAAQSASFPPATGTARVSPDGSDLLFVSTAEPTGYPGEGQTEAFLYTAAQGAKEASLTCVSCNPTGERPKGPAQLPGAYENSSDPLPYKPRSLSADGTRVFFDSGDSLVSQDTNESADVYEWEAKGTGSCTRAPGCVDLISSGRDSEPSSFLDADGDGDDAFFLTAAALYPPDPGSVDVYDARVGGGLSVPPNVIACNADACQVLPEAPEDPTPGTLAVTGGNPPLRIAGAKKKPKHKAQKKGGGKKHRQGRKR
jgi:hypothetical protein